MVSNETTNLFFLSLMLCVLILHMNGGKYNLKLIFIYSKSFYQKFVEKGSSKKYLFLNSVSFGKPELRFISSNKPSQYLLNCGDFLLQQQHFQQFLGYNNAPSLPHLSFAVKIGLGILPIPGKVDRFRRS